MKKYFFLSLFFANILNSISQVDVKSWDRIINDNPNNIISIYDSLASLIDSLPDSVAQSYEVRNFMRNRSFFQDRLTIANSNLKTDPVTYGKMLNSYVTSPICVGKDNNSKPWEYAGPFYD